MHFVYPLYMLAMQSGHPINYILNFVYLYYFFPSPYHLVPSPCHLPPNIAYIITHVYTYFRYNMHVSAVLSIYCMLLVLYYICITVCWNCIAYWRTCYTQSSLGVSSKIYCKRSVVKLMMHYKAWVVRDEAEANHILVHFKDGAGSRKFKGSMSLCLTPIRRGVGWGWSCEEGEGTGTVWVCDTHCCTHAVGP